MERPPPGQREPYAAVFAQRFEKVEPSFIREILKVAANPEIISFAGGLPNPICSRSRPSSKRAGRAARAGSRRAAIRHHRGLCPAAPVHRRPRLSRHGMAVNPDNILITSGSQQALDLLGKVLVNEGRISSSKSRATLAPSRRSPSINRISSPLPWRKRAGSGRAGCAAGAGVQRQAALRRAQLPEPERCFLQPRQPGRPWRSAWCATIC